MKIDVVSIGGPPGRVVLFSFESPVVPRINELVSPPTGNVAYVIEHVEWVTRMGATGENVVERVLLLVMGQ